VNTTHFATRIGDRLFVRSDGTDERWTWELFPGHWDDGLDLPVLVGREVLGTE
jgi:hypothetical protein